MYNSANVAKIIKELAKERKVSVKKVLDDVGLNYNTMTNMKTSMPKADNLAKIADYFNVSVDYLLGRVNTTNNTNSTHIKFDDIRLLLSDECTLKIIENLSERFNRCEIDDFLSHTKYTLNEVKGFLTTDLSLHRDVNMLFDLLAFFDTNVYTILKDSVFKGYTLYEKLDTDDKAEIRVRIKQLLEESNYTAKETSFGASTPKEDIAQEVANRLNTPINTK